MNEPSPIASAGRSCPLAYRYNPEVFQRTPERTASTLYVIGGLYGNLSALDAVERLARREVRTPQLIFNGDFHWFDIDPAVFAELHRRVLQHTALRGNVETELAGDDNAAGCGCAYPDQVGDDEVARSNQILLQLRSSADAALGAARADMLTLPMHLLAQVGPARIGIVHGDATSLAGWDFSRERLDDPSRRAAMDTLFRRSSVTLFASSHTCLPVLRTLTVDGRSHAIINNGAAGMPNFSATQFGVISRIADTPTPAGLPLLHESILPLGGENIYVSALALDYDPAAWRRQFLQDWPPASPAHASYLQRIDAGPAYRPTQAYPADRTPVIARSKRKTS